MTSLCYVELAKMLNTPKIAGSFLSKENLLLTIAAGGASGIGFLYDDYSLILGSMLISPLENTIVQSMLSILLGNKMGSINGLLSLTFLGIFTIGIGFLIGEVNNYFNNYYITPSENMKKITSDQFLLTNFFIGVLCGFFMSYATITKNIAVLHGLSIIIFILPPLVNSGIYASLARYNKVKNNELYLEYKKNSMNSFKISLSNICGLGVGLLLGFLVFCPN
uniref:Uncharacterized protein n=1 Tax=viral metagenome TaxID=1070528 RepID=A0A6C0E8T6_9ZZZZ